MADDDAVEVADTLALLPDGPAVLVLRPETITLTAASGDDERLSGVAIAARLAGTHLAVDPNHAG